MCFQFLYLFYIRYIGYCMLKPSFIKCKCVKFILFIFLTVCGQSDVQGKGEGEELWERRKRVCEKERDSMSW